MASEVAIYNMAAAAIGATTRITDPKDNRTIARNIRAVWDIQRQAAIREGSWNFAVQRQQLGATTSAPEHGYEYAFELPAACLRLIEVHDLIAYRDYQLEGRLVLTNVAGPLNIRFLADVKEPASWDTLFAEAFAYRIAWAIGTRIAGSSFDRDKVWRQYQDALKSAKRVDAQENPSIKREESDWITARHASASWDIDV
ncbi:MAG: hypothetical protein B7Y88_13875 [Sphingomonadales bacterium 32-64-17]|nr:MAG: hypothetical protein B7Y88_13875 [Sphingomonadales bacterium 32-64-17]